MPSDTIINTRLFDYERTSQSAAWAEELNKAHTPETVEYDISSFVFKDQRPFEPERFWMFVTRFWPGNVIRSKGLFWLASRPADALNWSQAGGSLRAEPAGSWWAAKSLAERRSYQEYHDNRSAIEGRWHPVFGDRLNELVIIGQNLDEDASGKNLKTASARKTKWPNGLPVATLMILGQNGDKDGNTNPTTRRLKCPVYENTVDEISTDETTAIGIYHHDVRMPNAGKHRFISLPLNPYALSVITL